MGNPPKPIVIRKLIRRYFKKKGDIHSEEAAIMKNELIQCWETFGVDHPKCSHLVPKYDRAWALDLSLKEKYQM